MYEKINIDGVNIWNIFIFAMFLLWFNSMFYFNNALIFNDLFLYILAPLSFIPLNIYFDRKENRLGANFYAISWAQISEILFTPQFIAIIVYLLSISVSTAVHPTLSIDWLLFMWKLSMSNLFFIWIILKLFFNIRYFMEIFFGISAVCLSISAILNLVVYFNSLYDITYFSEIRMVSEFGHGIDHASNSAGLVYALFLVSSSYLVLKSSSLYQRLLLVSCSAILFLALILTHSRGSMAGVMSALIVAIALSKGRTRYIQVSLLLSFISIFLFFRRIAQMAFQRLDNNRLEIWNIFIKYCKKEFLLGYGERHKFEEVIKNGEIIYHPHNMLLGAQILGGLLATISFVVISVSGIFYSYKYFIKTTNLLPLMLIVVTEVAGLVDFRIEVLGAGWSWIVFWLPISLSFAACKRYSS